MSKFFKFAALSISIAGVVTSTSAFISLAQANSDWRYVRSLKLDTSLVVDRYLNINSVNYFRGGRNRKMWDFSLMDVVGKFRIYKILRVNCSRRTVAGGAIYKVEENGRSTDINAPQIPSTPGLVQEDVPTYCELFESKKLQDLPRRKHEL